jgi:hypothetical protein
MLTRVYSGNISAQTWNPEADALFFFVEESDVFVLYIAPAPDFLPIRINAGFDYPRMGDNLIWVFP